MTPRAVFDDEQSAHLVAARLRTDGFDADVAKEHFAGEDDDEDPAWAVSTDAPSFLVEVLAEEHDGWMEADPSPAASAPFVPPPLDLPDGPRRTKGHWPS